MKNFALAWSHGTAELVSTAGMLTRCAFRMPDGPFEPFARAPWLGGPPPDPTLTGHRRVLGGEFVAVPFGSAGRPVDAAAAWADLDYSRPNEPAHGPSAEEDWVLTGSAPGSVTLEMVYPPSSPVERLVRTVWGVDGEPTLRFRLEIHARRAEPIAVGLHPILRLPEKPGSLVLAVDFERGQRYPGSLGSGTSRGEAGSSFRSLSDVGAVGAGPDYSRLPLASAAEDVVQLCSVAGPLTAVFTEEGAGVRLDWDRHLLPSLLMWLSDRAGSEAWLAGYRGLGLEPIAAAFDLPNSVSTAENPLSRAGVRTALPLTPASPTVIDYSVSAFSTARDGSARDARGENT